VGVNTLTAGLLGAGAGLGLVIAIGAWLGELAAPAADMRASWQRRLSVDHAGARFGSAAAGLVVVGAATRWPAAAVIAAAAGWMLPDLRGAARRRDAALARTEAVALWAEQLRDSLAAGGLRDALRASRRVAPIAIRAEVARLVDRAEFTPLPAALRQFAAEVDDPVADSVVAALVIAVERQASGLRDLLSEVAHAARNTAAMRMRVESGRARSYQQARLVVGFSIVFSVLLAVASPSFMAPYGSAGGQVVLGIIGALFLAAMAGMNRLARPVERARLLGAVRGTV
jgi:tight adherence protein B